MNAVSRWFSSDFLKHDVGVLKVILCGFLMFSDGLPLDSSWFVGFRSGFLKLRHYVLWFSYGLPSASSWFC